MAALQAVDDANTERDTLKAEVKQLRAELDAAAKAASAAAAAQKQLHAEQSSAADETSRLRARVAQLESELRDRESKDRIEARGSCGGARAAQDPRRATLECPPLRLA